VQRVHLPRREGRETIRNQRIPLPFCCLQRKIAGDRKERPVGGPFGVSQAKVFGEHPMLSRLIAVVSIAAFLSACAASDVIKSTGVGFSVPETIGGASVADTIAGADWSRAQTVNLRVRQGDFEPALLNFRNGIPYVLKIENTDDYTYSFKAGEFFETIAVKSLVPVDEGMEAVPEGALLVSVKLAPGETRELSFVPLRSGFYYFENGYPGLFYGGLHLAPLSLGTFGFGGAITIE
jgi:hypothetical protein